MSTELERFIHFHHFYTMKVRDYYNGNQQKDIILNQKLTSSCTTTTTATEHMPCSVGSSYFGTVTTSSMPTFMETHPYAWSKEDVYTWLDWCRKEYALSDVPLEKFSMNGKALCVLTKEDFKERAPNVGDVLFNTLQQFATTNLHPSFRNGLSHVLPPMATPAGLLMPAAAAAMCNTFIPAAHLQHLLGQAAYAAPMTPDSSPSAPSVSSNSSNPTPPRNTTPVNQEPKPVITVTEPSGNTVVPLSEAEAKIPVGVLNPESIGSRTPSPSRRSNHSSPRRSPNSHQNRSEETEILRTSNSFSSSRETLPVLQKESQSAKQHETNQSEGDQPLNLSRRPSESLPTPSPPLLTPHVKAELPDVPGAGLQAALKAYLPKNLSSTAAFANRQSSSLLTVPGSEHIHQSITGMASPSIPLVIRKINQSGGEVTVSPDPKYAFNSVQNPMIQNLVKEIKKEPGTESMDLSHRNHLIQQYHKQSSLVEHARVQHKESAPVTPSYDPISPCGDDADLETPFSPPVTPGGTLLGFTPATPNGTMGPSRPDGTGKLLWEFLSEMLNDPVHQSDPKPIVRWIDMNTYTFQILDTGRLSSLWGQQKNRGTMNYEKLSRALRYYKKVGIIEKATGKRLTYKFMKPPSSIRRGQRGARPGVPRRNRRQSLLQSQQSVNEEAGSTSPARDTDEQAATPRESTQYAITPMPQFMASGTMKTSLQHVINQRNQALAGVPLTSMLAGLPLVVPPSAALHFNGALNKSSASIEHPVVNYHVEAKPSSERLSPKPPTISEPEPPTISEPESNSDSATAASNSASEHSASDSEPEKTEVAAERKESQEIEAENAKLNAKLNEKEKHNVEKKKTVNNHAKENGSRAVHMGMPIPVPTYTPTLKAKSASLSKRRLASSSGDGNTPKKFPRLILPKSTTISPERMNRYVSQEKDQSQEDKAE